MKTIFFFLLVKSMRKKLKQLTETLSKIIDIEITFFVQNDQLLIAFLAMAILFSFLGISMLTLTPEIMQDLEHRNTTNFGNIKGGVYVSCVNPVSPAERYWGYYLKFINDILVTIMIIVTSSGLLLHLYIYHKYQTVIFLPR